MGQMLRVTVGTSDYSFKLLSVADTEISVELDGQTHRLKREGNSWVSTGDVRADPRLADAIGRAIGLRYRI